MPSAPLTDAERTDCRRFAGYPAFGLGPNDGTFNRYSVGYEILEYRLGNLTDAELTVIRAKVADLVTLDAAIVASSANLDTDSAAVWKHNRDEVAHRSRLYSDRRRDLCGFMGIPAGPAMSMASGMSFVV